MNTCDSKGMAIEKEGSESIIIDINTRVILEEHIAAKLRQDVSNDAEKQICRNKKDVCCAKRLEKDNGCLSSTEMTSLESLKVCKTSPHVEQIGGSKKQETYFNSIEKFCEKYGLTSFVEHRPRVAFWLTFCWCLVNIGLLIICFCGSSIPKLTMP